MLSNSPATASPSMNRVRKTPSNQGVQSRSTSINTPQHRTPSANAQSSSTQRMKTPSNTREQAQTLFTQTPAALRAHLPTPQKPISTGPCPNTVNETLEETNHRTAPQLRGIAVPMMNTDPIGDFHMNDENMLNGYPTFQMPSGTGYPRSGLPFQNMDFTEMMGTDMNLPTGFNMNANGYTTENPNMNAFQNMGPPANMHVNVRQPDSSMHTNDSTNASNAPLDLSLLNSNVRTSSVGYAETVASEPLAHTPTPANNMTANATVLPPMNNTADTFPIMHPENDTTSSPAGGAGPEALPAGADGTAAFEGLPEIPADWLTSFDEHAAFNAADWGF